MHRAADGHEFVKDTRLSEDNHHQAGETSNAGLMCNEHTVVPLRVQFYGSLPFEQITRFEPSASLGCVASFGRSNCSLLVASHRVWNLPVEFVDATK